MSQILMIAALVMFILAGVGVGGKVNLVAFGLACWIGALILGR